MNANVRELFDLDAQEHIYDDFQCKEGKNITSGRMYLTEKHLCYYRSVMTMSKKIKIAWLEIASIDDKGDSTIFI